MRLIGITGWSGSGKTELITRIIPLFTARGLAVATLKHAHHDFDLDVPGKDSWRHRQAGASQVLIASARRVAHLEELAGKPEPPLSELLRRLSPCDLVLVEGFKRSPHVKIEVVRPSLGKRPLFRDDRSIVAVIAEREPAGIDRPWLGWNEIDAVAALILRLAAPLGAVLASLEADGATV